MIELNSRLTTLIGVDFGDLFEFPMKLLTFSMDALRLLHCLC